MDTFVNQYYKNHTNLRLELKTQELTVKEYSKMIERINYSFSKMRSYTDIIEIVEWLRTALQGIDERKVEMIVCGNRKYCKVVYNKRELIEYMTNININDEFVNIHFKRGKIRTDCSLTKEAEQAKQVITNGMDEIITLKEIKALKLTEEEEKMCKYFKAFYEKNPNFHKEEIYEEMNLLYSLLALFQIPFNKERYLPNSIVLQNTIYSLTPFGEIDASPFTSTEEKEEKILKIMKEGLDELLKNSENRKIVLEELAKKIYVSSIYFSSAENQKNPENTLERIKQSFKSSN